MTVSELIERLQQLPGALTVQFSDSQFGSTEVESADIESYAGPRAVVIR